LGSNTSYANGDFVDYSYIKVYQEALRHFNSFYYLGLGYNLDYHFNITDKTPVTDYPQYNGTASHTISSGWVLHFMYDSRTNINNPKDAFYGSIIYRDNSALLGSDQNWQYVQLEVRKYFKLSAHKVLAFWSWNEFTFGGKAPYFDLPGNGWDTYSNTGRGYIQGRFRGPDMIYGETELRFGITRNGLLGGVIFANATSVANWPDVKFDEIFPGEGVGLRIKFNKYSDVNVCIDYGFGIQGSRGIFFNLGEVF
jgi:outer membrane protein assembly factor BamA